MYKFVARLAKSTSGGRRRLKEKTVRDSLPVSELANQSRPRPSVASSGATENKTVWPAEEVSRWEDELGF